MTQKSRKPGPSKLPVSKLIDHVNAQTGLSKAQSKAVVQTVLEIVTAQLRGGTAVGLPGLGVFSVTATNERQGTRPGTGEAMTIPAGHKVRFKVAAALKKDLSL